MEPLVLLDGVDLSRGGQPILRRLSLEVGLGEVVGIAGPNGTGKTTLIRLVATLLPPNRGRGTVLGARLGSAEVYPVRPRIGMIGHVPMVIPELTLAENLVHAARLSGADPTRVERVLRVVGLERAAGRRAEAASFGMLRRAEVARLLLAAPSLLLLDEAVTGLDPAAQALIDALVQRATGGAGGVLMVSHDPEHLRRRCHRLYHLADGKLEVKV